ncbi:P-loop containing nucleoside triphosphate hydrolase protein [Aspergillus crustosus]
MADPQSASEPSSQTTVQWFHQAHGPDAPVSSSEATKKRGTWLVLKTGKAFEIEFRVSLDPQQPAVHILPGGKSEGTKNAFIVFPLQTTGLGCGIESETTTALDDHVKSRRAEHDFLGKWPKLAVYCLYAWAEPVIPFQEKPAENRDWKKLVKMSWIGVEFTIFHPAAKDGPTTFRPWEIRNSFFVDMHEFRFRTIEPSLWEREEQRKQFEDKYNPGRFHRAQMVPAKNPAFHYLFIRLGATQEEAELVLPDIVAGTEVRFMPVTPNSQKLEKGDLKMSGKVVEMDGTHDLAVFVKRPMPHETPNEFLIATYIKAHLLPITEQIIALGYACSDKSFGDPLENKGELGFSLTRTLLGHGSELNPDNEHYFVMDARLIDPPRSSGVSSLSTETRLARLKHIQECFKLDKAQQEAFYASVTAMVCGVSLVQGLPRTGRTRTSVVIILALAALGHKVMLAGGLNTGVDKLSEDIVKAPSKKKHSEIRKWTGGLIRSQTPARQIAEVRSKSRALGRRPGPGSVRSVILEVHEMRNRVMKFARTATQSATCKRFLQIVEENQVSPLSSDLTKELKRLYGDICNDLLRGAKIVSTTLSNSAADLFRYNYSPSFLVCDEAGQCTEGETAIALTLGTLHGITLIGDPDQLHPTIISERSNNEGAFYLKRSLMDRLKEAGYTCTMLVHHYRCHEDIMEFFNRVFYDGKLLHSQADDHTSIVGYVWHEFTRVHHHFHAQGLENIRRMCLSVDSMAQKPVNSTSWVNYGQVKVLCQYLRALLAFRAPNGMAIVPDELEKLQLDVRENITVDSAPLVFFLSTKPSQNAGSAGFMADKHRLDVAVSRAQDLLVVISNLAKWNPYGIQKMVESKAPTAPLVALLKDVSAKGHTLTWNGECTVTERAAPPGFIHPCHDSDVPDAAAWDTALSCAVKSVADSMHTPKEEPTPVASTSDLTSAQQQGLAASTHAQSAAAPSYAKTAATTPSVQTKSETPLDKTMGIAT